MLVSCVSIGTGTDDSHVASDVTVRHVCLHVLGVVLEAVDELLGRKFPDADAVHCREDGVPATDGINYFELAYCKHNHDCTCTSIACF